MDERDHDAEDIPFADPQIRIGYQVSLGRFLVQFNEIENLVSELILLSLTKVGLDELGARLAKGRFSERLEYLKALNRRIGLGVSDEEFATLKVLSTERNTLAHGHFDQNPFDGSYEVVTEKHRKGFPTSQIEMLTRQAESIVETLKIAELGLMFGPPPQPQQTTP
jgi:hypothetical protein